jgi:hypothetical protein
MKGQRAGLKLISAGIFLAIALVMLVTASLAWFTISTNPEIGGMQVSLYTGRALLLSDRADGEYTELLNLGDVFSSYVELKPVSTVDGVNWFLPEYNAAGQLKDAEEFTLDNTLAHANISKAGLEGEALKLAREQGAYVWADIWLKTQEEHCDVRLSIPSRSSAELDQWERDRGTYGTYVLGTYRLSGENIATLDTVSQAAMRVGFLVGEGTAEQRFIIYEPNADQRSANIKPGDITYVSGYTRDEANYKENYYIPTHPIANDGSGKGIISNIHDDNLIIQLKSSWDNGSLESVLRANVRRPGSNEVDIMGQFIADNSALMAAVDSETKMADTSEIPKAIAGETVIISLEKNVPQKVRMFIWIEGQDVDCWNDIAAGSFVVNLELAGSTD